MKPSHWKKKKKLIIKFVIKKKDKIRKKKVLFQIIQIETYSTWTAVIDESHDFDEN